MRQTELSLGELLEELKNPTFRYPYPKCLLINEVGEICRAGDKKAEEFLRELLASDNPEEQFLAVCWLSSTENIDQEASQRLEEFKKNPDNREIVARAKASVIALKAQYN